MTRKSRAKKLFSLEEDSLTSLREGSAMKFLSLYSILAYRMPSYQKTAVKNFLAQHPPSYTSAQYNNSGVCTYSLGIFSPNPHNFPMQTARAFPDLSANGYVFYLAANPPMPKMTFIQAQTTSLVCSFPGTLTFSIVLTTTNSC